MNIEMIKDDDNDKSDLKTHACVSCKESFETSLELHEHLQVFHKNSLKYECETCGETFYSSLELDRHVASFHSKNFYPN